MTYVLELEPEIARKFEEQAAQNGTTPQEMLKALVKSNLKGAEDGDAKFDAATKRVFAKYSHAFEVLAEGAK